MSIIHTELIQKSAQLLREGRLVAFPTETVYGLGADARNPQALTDIFLAKQRPFSHPLIVHLADFNEIQQWAIDVPAFVSRLAANFWPGPLTLILKKRPEVSNLLTGNQNTIGIRIPAHPVAQALLRNFGSGIAAPSANRYTRISPTTAEAVKEELGDKVDYILEGGTCAVGIESTILDLSGNQPAILRPGIINAQEIEKVLNHRVSFLRTDAPRVSGTDLIHYAPETRLVLISTLDFLQNLPETELPIAVLTREVPSFMREGIYWIRMATKPKQYAHDLYHTLRELDKKNFKKIMVVKVPESEEWRGVSDRIWRGAEKVDF